MPPAPHPETVLFDAEQRFPLLPAVDHYAGTEARMKKAMLLQHEFGPVFDITFDCEDGAEAGAEAAHAKLVASLLSSEDNRFGRIGVRIHDVTHEHWRRDLEILIEEAGQHIAFLTLPKARTAGDVFRQIECIEQLEQKTGASRTIPTHILIETHGALREIWDIAAHPRVQSLDFGLMDFVSAHHGALSGAAMRSPQQFTHPLLVRAKTEIVAAAVANGAVPSHNVTTELSDIGYIHDDARRAREDFGFLRMWSIHPNQIRPILDAMRPDFDEIGDAAAIICGAQDALWGPIRHAGKLHDRASYRYYWEVLRRARMTGATLPQGIEARFFATSS